MFTVYKIAITDSMHYQYREIPYKRKFKIPIVLSNGIKSLFKYRLKLSEV